MSKVIAFIGLCLHYCNRAANIIASRYHGWTLRHYLTLRSRHCGSVHIAGPGRFSNISGLELGDNIHINTGAYWVCEGGLHIGDNTIFAKNVTIYTRNHNHTGHELPFDHSNIMKPVHIGRNVWVGANVTILPGAKIGDGAIIGAGAVVAGVVPERAIFGATKAQIIGHRDESHYQKLDREKSYHKPRYVPW